MLDTGEEVELKVEGDEVAVAEEIPAIEAEADVQDGTEPKAEDDPGEEPEELVVSFEGEEPQPEEEEGTPIIRILRKQLREAQKQLKDAQKAKPADMAEELGAKPTLQSCDYDDARFERELLDWKDRETKVKAKQAEQEADAEKAQAEWNATVARYNERKAKINVADFQGYEEEVQSVLSPVQFSIAVDVCEAPEVVVYALAKHPAKAKALADIANPIKFAVALAKMERDMKVSGTKPKPAPEKRLPADSVPQSSKKVDPDKMSAAEYAAWRNAGGTFSI